MFDPKTKFLIVDDFATMRKVVKNILDQLGYKNVVEATDGKIAFEILEKCLAENDPVQFVISDWNMPNMAGIELLKACRQSSNFKYIPFMMVTAESEKNQIIEAIKSEVSEYVTKPFNPATLKLKIERVYQKTTSANKITSKVG